MPCCLAPLNLSAKRYHPGGFERWAGTGLAASVLLSQLWFVNALSPPQPPSPVRPYFPLQRAKMPGRRCWYRASRATRDKWAAERQAKLLEMAAASKRARLVCAGPCLHSNCGGEAAYKATVFHSYDWLNRLSFKLAQEPAADSQIAELRFLPFPVGRGPHRGRARPPRQRGGQGRQALAHEPRRRGRHTPAPVPGSLHRTGMRSLRAVRSRPGCSAAKCPTPVVGLRAPRACSWALEKAAAPACARRRRRWWTRPSASASTRGSSPRGRHS